MDPVSASLLVLPVTLNSRSRDVVDPRLLDLHLRPGSPEAGRAELRQEVQKIVAVGWHARMNVEALAHALLIFHLFCSDLSVQLTVVVQLMVMRDS